MTAMLRCFVLIQLQAGSGSEGLTSCKERKKEGLQEQKPDACKHHNLDSHILGNYNWTNTDHTPNYCKAVSTSAKHSRNCKPRAEGVINVVSIKVSTSNVHLFLAGNHIWYAVSALPGMSDDTRRSIYGLVKVSVARHSSSEVGWCIDRGRELEETGKVLSRTLDDSREEHITRPRLFQIIANKLPVEVMPWVRKNEDSHAHGVLDAILMQLFPEGRAPYEMV
ncbi:hypothetical protein DFQ27_008946 [Actinomortierella ambigua]|uniref:Uncharacterized protein n=1 Tax=Actinomortierella ambigua TaxID=1343610 RepID=A0A9P6TXR3_9FUNG|nr:hypothetical protein DFQ27_008946 [Actinomortierella ambigua]